MRPIRWELVDIDNEPRNLYFPYMGADESTDYPLPVELLTFTANVSGNSVITLLKPKYYLKTILRNCVITLMGVKYYPKTILGNCTITSLGPKY